MVPVTKPAACGENVTVSGQDLPGATVEHPPWTANDVEEELTELTLSGADPPFLTMMVFEALVPTVCCEKMSGLGWRLMAGLMAAGELAARDREHARNPRAADEGSARPPRAGLRDPMAGLMAAPTPMPSSGTTCSPPVSVIVRVPVCCPGAGGMNVTSTEHVPPGLRRRGIGPHITEAKSEVGSTATPTMVSVPVPAL